MALVITTAVLAIILYLIHDSQRRKKKRNKMINKWLEEDRWLYTNNDQDPSDNDLRFSKKKEKGQG